MEKIDLKGVSHAAIIMDGNRRWAKQKGVSSDLGHKEGANAFKNLVKFCLKTNLKILTVFAFSTENWARDTKEIKYLMSLVENDFKKYIDNMKKNGENKNCKITIIGTKTGLTNKIKNIIEEIQKKTKDNTDFNLVIAFNYGGRMELTEAIKKIAMNVQQGKLSIDEISEKTIKNFLYTKDIPDPDLIIRTGGIYRFSNFLPWQSIYSEYVFVEKLWPDFKSSDFMLAIDEFHKRKRHFGG